MEEKKQPKKITFANGSEIVFREPEGMTPLRGINHDNIYVLTNDKEMEKNGKN